MIVPLAEKLERVSFAAAIEFLYRELGNRHGFQELDIFFYRHIISRGTTEHGRKHIILPHVPFDHHDGYRTVFRSLGVVIDQSSKKTQDNNRNNSIFSTENNPQYLVDTDFFLP